MLELQNKIGKYRWTICSLVFFATTINYLDRNVLGLLKSNLSANGVFGSDVGNQELYYSYIVISFQFAYAIGMLLAGRMIDWIGTKKGYFISLFGWSIAAIGHAFAVPHWELLKPETFLLQIKPWLSGFQKRREP
jgi:ACS family hexuronate transporter-like MFS transporter